MGGEAEGFAQAAAGSAVKGWPGRRAEAGRGYRSGSRPFAFRAGLAPVRFHDLRHGAASQCKAAGVDTKVISALLGHSRTDFTNRTYVLVFPEVAKAAAEAAAAIVPALIPATEGGSASGHGEIHAMRSRARSRSRPDGRSAMMPAPRPASGPAPRAVPFRLPWPQARAACRPVIGDVLLLQYVLKKRSM